MTISTAKTKIVRFSKARGREPNEKWLCQGTEIEKVKSVQYLEYTFQRNGKSEGHMKEMARKANIALAQIWGIGQRKFKNNFRLRMLLFAKLVAPILYYGAEIWGWKEQEEIEKIQNKYLRWTLSIDKTTPLYITGAHTDFWLGGCPIIHNFYKHRAIYQFQVKSKIKRSSLLNFK